MANISVFFDNRRHKADGTSKVHLQLSCKGKRVFIPTDISLTPADWMAVSSGKSRDTRIKRISATINRLRLDAEEIILSAPTEERVTVDSLRTLIVQALFPDRAASKSMESQKKPNVPDPALLITHYNTYMGMKSGKTLDSYKQTLSRLTAFADLSSLRLDDLSRSWLMQWDAFLSKTAPSPNSRAVYMRNLRAVINFAIDEGATTNYPFRRFHIKTVETAKRSLSVTDLRTLLTIQVDETQRQYRDMFALSFFLMGINFVDMLKLPSGADSSGRIVFNRSKTKKLYSMKVEPEAQAIIDRYRGVNWLLSAADRVSNHENYLRRTNKVLRTIGTTEIKKHGKKVFHPMFPDITTYWARHSWATMAAALDIPKDTIAAALGHGGNTVTDIYIDFYREKVDAANRRVIDWVLYGR